LLTQEWPQEAATMGNPVAQHDLGAVEAGPGACHF
jgi:hypothetical protein